MTRLTTLDRAANQQILTRRRDIMSPYDRVAQLESTTRGGKSASHSLLNWIPAELSDEAFSTRSEHNREAELTESMKGFEQQ